MEGEAVFIAELLRNKCEESLPSRANCIVVNHRNLAYHIRDVNYYTSYFKGYCQTNRASNQF